MELLGTEAFPIVANRKGGGCRDMGGTANKPWDRILGPPQGDTLNNIFELFYRTSSVQSLGRV